MGAKNSKTKGLGGGKDNSHSKGKPTSSISRFQPSTLSQSARPSSKNSTNIGTRDPLFVDNQGVVHVYHPVKTISIARLPSPNVKAPNMVPLSLMNPNSQQQIPSTRSRSDSRSSVGTTGKKRPAGLFDRSLFLFILTGTYSLTVDLVCENTNLIRTYYNTLTTTLLSSFFS